jgi:flagellar protein FlbT
MPLKLKLGANERLVVNGAVLVNGAYRTTLMVRNYAHIMREKDVLQVEDANTPTKRVYLLIQSMLMMPPPPAELIDSYRLAHGQLLACFVRAEDIELLHDVDRLVSEGDYYKALTRLHPLIAYEAALLDVPAHTWRRAPGRQDEDQAASGRPAEAGRKLGGASRSEPPWTR